MRKVTNFIFVLMLSGLGAIAASAAPKPADQARTMDDVIDRVITNENRASQQIRQYSPLVETYIQNLKPEKDLRLDRQLLFLRAAICAGRLSADDLHRHEWVRQGALQV